MQRPYESLISIVSKFPWYATDLYTLKQRDLLFQAVFDLVELLKRQIKKGHTAPSLGPVLLRRLCKVSMECRGFTDFQKRAVLMCCELPEFESAFYTISVRNARVTLGNKFQGLGLRDGIVPEVSEVHNHLYVTTLFSIQFAVSLLIFDLGVRETHFPQ